MKAYALILLLSAAAPAAAETPSAQVPVAERAALLSEIEDWKVLLPADPDAPLSRRFIPGLHAVKTEAAAARTAPALAAARGRFEARKKGLLSVLYAVDAGRFKGGAAAHAEFAESKRRALVEARDAEAVLRGAGPGLAQTAAQTHDELKRRIRAASSPEDLSRLYDNLRAAAAPSAPPALASPVAFSYSAPRSAPPPAPAPRSQLPPRLKPEAAPAPPPPADDDAPRDYAALRAALVRRGVGGAVVDEVLRQSRAQGVDPLLVLAMIQAESSFRARVVSGAGAIGLMQIMPATGKDLGVSESAALFNPAVNIRAGIKYMKGLWSRFARSSWDALDSMDVWKSPGVKMVVAAYNAGPGAVRKYGGVPPFRETQRHVVKVLTYFLQFKKLATPAASPSPSWA